MRNAIESYDDVEWLVVLYELDECLLDGTSSYVDFMDSSFASFRLNLQCKWFFFFLMIIYN